MTDVLFLVQGGNVDPWLIDFMAAAEGRISVALLDLEQPLAAQFEGVSVIVDQGGHATRDVIDAGAAAGIKLWQVLGTGLDHCEVEYTLSRGIRMANTPGQFSSIALAEHALLLILVMVKSFPEAVANCRAGTMYQPVGEELGDQVLGLVGLGASGRELAIRANCLGMRVRAVDVVDVPKQQLRDLGVESFAGLDGLDDLLRASDFVSLHVPLTSDTIHLIDERRLRLMKPTARLVNVARGRIVDEEALVRVLRERAIAGAGIDVFGQEPLQPDNPLLHLDNVVTTPHTAGVTRGTSRRRARASVDNAVRVLRGEEPLYGVTPAG